MEADYYLAVAVQITVVLTFIGGLFSYFIMQPLHKAIRDLTDLVNRIKESTDEINHRLIRNEERAKSAHRRIDSLEESMHCGKWNAS